MSMSSVDAGEGSSSSSQMAYSNPSIDLLMAEKEYARLITFVKDSAPLVKCQLVNFFYPFYVYIYLLLLKDEKLSEAQKFVSIYSRLFLNAEGYGEVIKDLIKFKTLEDAQDHSYFKKFCENKFKLKVSEDSLKLLKKYLEDAECKVLSLILNVQFHIEVIEDESDHEQSAETSCVKKKEPSDQMTGRLENISSTRSVDIKKICDGLPIYHYTIAHRKEQLCCVDINQKNALLAGGFASSDICVWNMDPDILNGNISPPRLKCALKGHTGEVYGVGYASPHLLLSCSEDTTVRAWSMTDFENVSTYCDHKYPIWDIAVCPKGVYFATASLDCTARLWSLERSSSLRIYLGHTFSVDCIAFHPNSLYLATASADKTVQLWTVGDCRSVRTFSGHDTYINSIAFSPDGRLLASADDSGYIKLWDLGTGKLYSEIIAHSKRIVNISYNADGSLIASCGLDSLIKVWNVKHSSSSSNEKEKNEFQAVSSVDCHSVPHYVSFQEKNLLLSVGTQMRAGN